LIQDTTSNVNQYITIKVIEQEQWISYGEGGETPFVGHTIQQKEYQELIRLLFQWNCTHIKNREGRSFTRMVYIAAVAAAVAVIVENKFLGKSMRWLNPRGKWNKVVAR